MAEPVLWLDSSRAPFVIASNDLSMENIWLKQARKWIGWTGDAPGRGNRFVAMMMHESFS
jgi:hypothetical protein